MKVQRKRKAGRPHGRVPRPPIPIDGDILIAKTQAAEELGVNVRTITRMRPPTTYFGNVAYIAIGALRRQIADGMKKKRVRR